MLNENEIKELRKEYFSISDKINSLQSRQLEIDLTINNNTKEKVASRFIPLKFGDKVRVHDSTNSEYVGFFGSWVLDGHQYTEDMGESRVKLRLYDIKKDGTRSLKYDEIYASRIVSIEKAEE